MFNPYRSVLSIGNLDLSISRPWVPTICDRAVPSGLRIRAYALLCHYSHCFQMYYDHAYTNTPWESALCECALGNRTVNLVNLSALPVRSLRTDRYCTVAVTPCITSVSTKWSVSAVALYCARVRECAKPNRISVIYISYNSDVSAIIYPSAHIHPGSRYPFIYIFNGYHYHRLHVHISV